LTAPRRSLLWVTAVLLVVTGLLLPIAGRQLGEAASFLPAMLSVVACFDLLSVYLLVGDYRDRGDPRMLMMAWAYACSLTLMAGYALAFPGAVSVDPLLDATPSLAPYLYVSWHTAFPVLLGAAWAPWPARWVAPTPQPRRRADAVATVTAAALLGVAAVALFSVTATQLPVLINGLDTSAMTTVTSPIAMPLAALALWASLHGTRRRTGPERWSSVAILTCVCDLLLTYLAASRFSLGWYAGRSLTLIAAGIVLVAMLAEFRRLKATAEHDAGYDPLTGLHNRRSAYSALDQMYASYRRSGSSLGVLSIDLDHFKSINDTYGHDCGDDVLVEVGRTLARSCRQGDVVARMGGEEFLMMLPDTDEDGALVVAEKVRSCIEAMTVPSVAESITASVGAAALSEPDYAPRVLLHRVDQALYEAKNTGRNCVVLATRPGRLTPLR
jgi:diguanylate cyclase (GGDEF)-like protein